MSAELDAILRDEMTRWESRGLRRSTERPAESTVPLEREFTSNDYLSLAHDPRLVEAARDAIERFGVGGRAARLLGGGCELDLHAEEACADWLDAEAALLFPSGYQANLGLLGGLAAPGAAIFSDRGNHASIIDAARLSRARVHVYRHSDVAHLEELLRAERSASRRIVVTESVFSMDGDLAPLDELHELCVRHDAHLVIDEAHAVGLLGPRRAGAWSAIDSKGSRLAARLVTGGKALGVSGSFVTGSGALREHLVNHARSFVFTTALSPAISGALCRAIEIARSEDDRARRALEAACTLARRAGLPAPAAAIVPFEVGASGAALELATRLRGQRFDVRAVRPPTVPEGSARLRVACHAHNGHAAATALGNLLAREPRRQTVVRATSTSSGTLVVAGTDTDVGKTVVSALLARAASRLGPVTYWKPVQTGDASDTAAVGRLAGPDVRLSRPRHEFPLPASPHTAARAAGSHIDIDDLQRTFIGLRAESSGTLIVELAGGLLVPYDDRHTQADFLKRLDARMVLVARAGLGTLNHTLLTLEALQHRGLLARALFLVGDRHAANAATLRERTGLVVHELERFATLDTGTLDAWLDAHDVRGLFP